MNTIETMKHIEKSLDKLYDMGDDILAEAHDEVIRQDVATLNFLLTTAKELAFDIAEMLQLNGPDEEDISEGEFIEAEEEFNDPSLDNFHEGEWGTTFPDMSEED